MKEYKRKDKLFITVIALACLIMTIANPESYDIRDLAWNYSLLLLLFSALFWLISEIGDLFSSFVFKFNADDIGVLRRNVMNLDGMSREQLLELANSCIDGDADLSNLTDEELAMLVMSKSGSVQEKKKSKINMLVRVYKIVKFVYISIVIVCIRLYRYIKSLPKTLRRKKKRSKKKETLQELIKMRNGLMKELGCDGKT